MSILAPLADRICRTDNLFYDNLVSIDFTPQNYSGTLDLSGCVGVEQIDYIAVKTGNLVCISFQSGNITKSGNGVITSTNSINSALYPSQDFPPTVMINGSVVASQAINIGISIAPRQTPTVGIVSIFNASTLNRQFGNTNNIAWDSFQIMYVVE